jgi:hypothetical protein
MANQRISWHCQACGGEIADSEGWLTVYRSDVVEAQRANEGFQRTLDGTPTGPSLRVRNVVPQPGMAAWAAYHHECDPRHDDALYSINIEYLRDSGEVLRWTLHFMDTKSWIEHTNWTHIVRRQMGSVRTLPHP